MLGFVPFLSYTMLLKIMFPCAALGLTFLPSLFSVISGSKPCDKIEAADWKDGKLLFIHGDNYVRVSSDRNEIEKGTVDQLNLPDHMDAMIQWPGNRGFYYFIGSEFYRDVLGIRSGPKNAITNWSDFFEDGIDAAGNRDGQSHFFKGCEYIVWSSLWSGSSEVKRIPKELPCDIDAAWDYENDWEELVIAKDDKIWFWGDTIKGPFPFSQYYTVPSLHLCSKQG